MKKRTKEQMREYQRKRRAKISNTPPVTPPVVTPNRTFPQTFKDAVGTEHPIDYETRRQMQRLFVDWLTVDIDEQGRQHPHGTPHQQKMAWLSFQYQIIKLAGHIDNLEPALQGYLGLDLSLTEMIKQGYWSEAA